jgi:hypothetical protein
MKWLLLPPIRFCGGMRVDGPVGRHFTVTPAKAGVQNMTIIR